MEDEMRKLIALAIVFVCALAFSQEWYPNRERIENLRSMPAEKDTAWYSYVDAAAFVWALKNERATYFDAGDFGLEYPVNLHGLSAYLYDSLKTYTYRIYARDGETVLFQSEPGISIDDFNDVLFDTPMIMTDNFWFSVIPQEDGLPRHVSTDVIESEHSYYKYDGAWKPFYNADTRYEWVNYVALEPYSGEDIYPPVMRTVSGLENFMGYDADVSISVQDPSGVVSTINGQYNVGAGWIDFSLTQVKGTFNYIGSVPGQTDGTTGYLKFYLQDTIGNAVWSSEYEVRWSKDIPILSEGFENAFPPAGWAVQNAGAGFVAGTIADGGFVYSGKVSAVHWDDSGAQDDWLITKKIALPTEYPSTLSFWQTTFWSYYYGLSEVSVSSDMVNWTKIYEPPYEADNEPVSLYYDGLWIKAGVTLAAWKGQEIYIGFHYQGDYSHQWYIDEVTVSVDNDVPEITKIYGNPAITNYVGAYLNNPLDITVETSDYTGTKSVVGHYTFDGGSSYTDIVFARSKSQDVWTAQIPTRSAEIYGQIYFTLEDDGGVIGNTAPYAIAFLPDSDMPVITYFSYGDPVFINNSMPLTVTFDDESVISSVLCYFSKDNWATQTPVVMTASKIHEFTYTGTIPAETVETFGEVRFVITDVPGNVLNSENYRVRWLEGYVVFYDDFDGSNTEETWFTDGGTWAYVNNEYHSPTTSLHDSPTGDYGDNMFNPVRTRIFDFSAAYAATMFLWAKIDIETGWDYCYLQATTDESTWKTLYSFNGEDKDWEFHTINLGSLALQPSVRLRFRMVTDAAVVCDGIYIDDVTLALFTKDYAPPLIEYAGPEVLTATGYVIPREFTIPVGLGDYKMNFDLTDISGISQVKVVYKVDGGEEQVSIPAVSSGPSGTYEAIIPAQAAGAQVRYKIVATDSSEYLNESETGWYMIRFGNFQYYQNGDDYTDYLDIIGNTPQASAQAVATRVTMGPMAAKDHYRSTLVGITIENYINTEGGYPSDPMHVHVWADEGGKPGKDLIDPIYTIQAATETSGYEITYVDLRPYADKLVIEGDVFVGFTSAGDVTNVLYEATANHTTVPGYIKFERSWLGTGDVSSLSWALDPASVYHISAVIDSYEYVDAPLPPQGLTASANISIGQIDLNWIANTETDLDYYNVYRGNEPSFAISTPVGTVAGTDPTTFTDTPSGGGDAQGYYYYKVTAVDADGNESTPSKEIKIHPTGISENLPLTTELYQNYPNPFNPETTIKFSVALQSKVELTVYNSNGQKVAELVKGEIKAGRHSVKFDGSGLTSGVYYNVLKVGDKVMTGKMIMLK
jgi:hypothetical protein